MMVDVSKVEHPQTKEKGIKLDIPRTNASLEGLQVNIPTSTDCMNLNIPAKM